MGRYIIKRLLMMIPVLLGVMVIVFFFQAISPYDPVTMIIGTDSTEEERNAKREELGLNDPIPVQYINYVKNFVTKGSLGNSYVNGKPIINELMLRFPITLGLALLSMTFSIIFGIPLGVLSAVKQYRMPDTIILIFTILGASIPQFWLALLLIQEFAVKHQLVPPSGIGSVSAWILPVVVLAVSSTSHVVRNTRSAMLETIRQDYVRTARAKGQVEWKVIIRHALRNSLIPIVTTIGNTLSIQVGGVVVIEAIFGMPGIGKYAVDAVAYRNFPAILGSVVILSLTFSVINLLVDLLYAVIDPRVKTALMSKPKFHFKKRATITSR